MSLLPKSGRCFQCGHDHGEGLGSPRELELLSSIAELERQNAELRKDAERYRQLRNKSALQFEHPIVVSQHHEVGEGMRYMGPVIDRELDRLVDYALAADQKGKAS